MKKKIKLRNILALVLIVYACYIFFNQQVTMMKIRAQYKESQEELFKIKDNNHKLQDEVKISKTDAYIEKMARERLHLIKEGETPVINNK